MRFRNRRLAFNGSTLRAERLVVKVWNLPNALRAISRLFGEHATDQIVQRWRNIRPQTAQRRRRLVQLPVNDSCDRSVIEWQRVREHLKKHDAERVNVGPAVYIFAEPELFR